VIQEQDGANLAAAVVFFKKTLYIFYTIQVFCEFSHAITLGVGVLPHSVKHEIVSVQSLEIHDE
jgi:hypothetical protein